MEFYNKTVIITGASVGIGKATAIEFAKNGANVCIVDIDAEGLNKVTEEIKSIGANVSSYICDVSDEQRVHTITQEIINQYGKIDILVNNAGLWRMKKLFAEKKIDPETISISGKQVLEKVFANIIECNVREKPAKIYDCRQYSNYVMICEIDLLHRRFH